MVVWLVGLTLPKLPPRYRASLWWAVSLKMVLTVLSPAISLPLLPAPEAPLNIASPVVPTDVISAPQATAAFPHATPFPPERFLFLAWIAGIFILLLAYLRQSVRLRRVLQGARPAGPRETEEVGHLARTFGLDRSPEVLTSEEIGTPMVVRAWRPTLVLPASFAAQAPGDELAMAVAHELAHVRSRDLLMGLVPALARLLLWFHPLRGSLRGSGRPNGRRPAMPPPSSPLAVLPPDMGGSSSGWPMPTSAPPSLSTPR